MSNLMQQWLSPNGIMALSVLLNLWLVWTARKAAISVKTDMKALEQNTNSKMDALLKAKDDLAIAQIGQATAEGKEAGRTDEVARVANLKE